MSRLYHSLTTAAGLAGVSPEQFHHYHQQGFLSQTHATAEGQPVFDDQAIYEVRRIEHLRRVHGVPPSALPLVWELLNEVEQLRAEARYLRNL